jgi:hypothetical protein
MELNKIILGVLERYKDAEPNMASEEFRELLTSELEKEVDKYCMTLIGAIACGSQPNNEYE